MPTHNRRRFIPLALECFRARTYPNKELVVVDDGDDQVADLLRCQVDILAIRARKRVLRIDARTLFVYLRHNFNTWKFESGSFLARSGWQSSSAPRFSAEMLESLSVPGKIQTRPPTIIRLPFPVPFSQLRGTEEKSRPNLATL